MKKLSVLFVMMLGFVLNANAQNAVANKFYEKFSSQEGAVTIDLSGSFLSFIGSMIDDDEDEDNFAKIAQDLTRIKVVSAKHSLVAQAEINDLQKAFMKGH